MENQQRIFEPKYLIDPYFRSESLLPTASERLPGGREQASGSSKGTEGALGLSKYHISTDTNIQYYVEGNLIRIKQKRFPKDNNVYIKDACGEIVLVLDYSKERKPVKRGEIVAYSKASRYRFMQKIAMVSKSELPHYLHLTYPNQFPSAQVSKKHLRAFLMRMKRRYPSFGYMWKMEFQKRGAPHFHIFVWGVTDYGTELFGWIASSWDKVCKTGDPNHVLAGTRIEKIKSWRGARYYSSKYMAKVDSTIVEEGIGRFWGCGGKIPWSTKYQCTLEPWQRHKLLRYLRRYTRVKSQRNRNFIVGNPLRWFELHKEITDPVPF